MEAELKSIQPFVLPLVAFPKNDRNWTFSLVILLKLFPHIFSTV